MLEDMRPTLERVKLGDKFVIFANCDKLPGYCLEDAMKWLHEVYTTTFKECQRIRRMQSEEMWKRYEAWGDEFADHREVKLYAERLVMFKQSCRNRPLIFKHNSCEMAITENQKAKPKNKAKKPKKDDA
jgi:hypothetical protein